MYQSYTKYDPDHPLVHCKACRGALFIMKGIEHNSGGRVAFETRCPHCKKDWCVNISVDDTHIIELTDRGLRRT